MTYSSYTVGIDLAPRYSGIAVLNQKTLCYYDNFDVGPESDGFQSNVMTLMAYMDDFCISNCFMPDETVQFYIEDVSNMMIKPGLVLRLQGALRYYLHKNMPSSQIHMVMPSTWQTKWLGWKKTPGTTSKGFSTFACKALGYEFDKSVKGKQATDLHDAVLIARYGYEKANNR